ncbi:MAG TPA: redoxin family protein [Armatimonadota bacterium]|jgi:hypothetical protein
MKQFLIAGVAAISLLPLSAGAKPVATKQSGMNGVRAVFDAASGKSTVYGACIPLTFTKDDAGKMLELVVDSPKPVVVELWTGDIPRGAVTWDKNRKFLGNSGAKPELKPDFKWMIEPGTYSALVLATMPPGQKPDPFVISWGKETRVPTEQDKKEWDKAVAKFTVSRILQAQAKRIFAPNFSTIATDHNPVSPQQYRGKVLLLQFTTGNDQATMDDLGFNWTTYQLHNAEGFDMLSIYLDSDSAAYTAINDELKIGWRQIFDASTANAAIAEKYGVGETPYTVLIDSAGRVVAQNIHREALRKLTLATLAEMKDLRDALKLVDDTPDGTDATGSASAEAKPADSAGK